MSSLIELASIPANLIDADRQRRLATALEFEGWNEADNVYQEIFAEIQPHACSSAVRARLLVDHALVLRRAGREAHAQQLETEAEGLLGGPFERPAIPLSSVDLLKKSDPARSPRAWWVLGLGFIFAFGLGAALAWLVAFLRPE